MILGSLEKINSCDIILGSGSQRRYDLLASLGLSFRTVVPEYDESVLSVADKTPEEYAIALAVGKGDWIAAHLKGPVLDNHLVISADTVVVVDGKILGKPVDRDDAFKMLCKLRGRKHKVVTGVALTRKGQPVETFAEVTVVEFLDACDLSDGELRAYVNTGEPLDKAGSYGIQGLGGMYVKRIEGCYYNVVGLPVPELCKRLNTKLA